MPDWLSMSLIVVILLVLAVLASDGGPNHFDSV